jgi:hypothetical protein
MALKKPVKGFTSDKPAAPPPGPPPIEKIIARIAADLPAFDPKLFEAALEEARQRPRASLQYLFGRIASGDPAARVIAAQLLTKIGGADVTDNLNALIFDIGQEVYVKVLANHLLAQLGSAVDADVFAMTVPQADEVERKFPSRALQLLKSGNVTGAVEHARTLHPTSAG